jgi:uncharacterized oligopeptide transporter (OPT) family protein
MHASTICYVGFLSIVASLAVSFSAFLKQRSLMTTRAAIIAYGRSSCAVIVFLLLVTWLRFLAFAALTTQLILSSEIKSRISYKSHIDIRLFQGLLFRVLSISRIKRGF